MTIRQKHSSRRGYTLVELVLVCVLGSVIVGAATTTFVALVATNGDLRKQQACRQAVVALARQWRTDVSAAASVTDQNEELASVPLAVHLDFADGSQVRYAAEPQGVLRTRYAFDGAAVSHRELFRIAPICRATYAEVVNDVGTFAALEVTRARRGGDTAAPLLAVLAASPLARERVASERAEEAQP